MSDQINYSADLARDIVAAIYWDLNSVWYLQNLDNKVPTQKDRAIFNKLASDIQEFLDYTVRDLCLMGMQPSLTSPSINRIRSFLFESGWRMFAICAQSEAFREAYLKESDLTFDLMRKLIKLNERSIDIFARSRNIDWRGPLLPYSNLDIPGIGLALQPEINLAKEHPHHVVQLNDGHLKRPIYEGQAQININEQYWKPERFSCRLRSHPFQRQELPGPCAGCICQIISKSGDLVELVEYPGKGIGVRALANFRKGDILGEYLGEIYPHPVECPDIVYNLEQSSIQKTAKSYEQARRAQQKLPGGARKQSWTQTQNQNSQWLGQPPLIESTVGDHFAKIVADYGDRTAVISKHQNDRVSYATLDFRSNALARGLKSIGVKKGERVGVMLGNSMEYAVATYALFKLGAILVPLNPSFNAMQVVAALGHLQASHLIISTESNLPRKDPRSNVPLLEDLIADPASITLESTSVPSLRQIVVVDNSSGGIDTSSYKSLTTFASITSDIHSDGHPLPPQDISPDEIVNIQFTSGTTAMPKAACLSHRSILNNGSQIGDRMLLTPNDIVCCPPPLFHCFGSILGYMATATHGSAIVFPTESFNARAALKAVQEEKCTALYGVPTMFLDELGLIEDGEVSREGFQYLRTGIAAGSSIPSELMKRLHRILNLTELTICYGMTETSPVSAMTTTDDPIDKRINSVGRLMPHVEAKVVDPENKTQILPIGKRGELAVSGYLLMKKYWDDPGKTAEVMLTDETGKVWMHTGDEASMSEDGYITITGRIKDLIIRGGENIHPLEIENCLLANAGVMNVSIVGVPDDRYGEAVAAFVVPRELGSTSITAEEIRQWVRERLSHHLVPKHIFFLGQNEAFPKTASGKIQKFKLRDKAIQLLADRQEMYASS
ncbi:hypothetical protein N7462_003867 [Penicillium macrosclerotiorum]|uniref:uncharacterized protein n=1 Tax=Penicillium macrosclerotiorum TaxID=303699 RepID=UPI002546D9FE|nr:uncharacterized protein N7462_003867 [Penicillium macrosclerotiorum]KAJ5689475.1 hypothetical protein N7462_003867 [Penicillium macrosclerotiorum]